VPTGPGAVNVTRAASGTSRSSQSVGGRSCQRAHAACGRPARMPCTDAACGWSARYSQRSFVRSASQYFYEKGFVVKGDVAPFRLVSAGVCWCCWCCWCGWCGSRRVPVPLFYPHSSPTRGACWGPMGGRVDAANSIALSGSW